MKQISENKKRRDVSALSSFDFNKENPFLKQSLEVIQNNAVKKYKTAKGTTEKAILQAFDHSTRELLGHTQFIRQIEVDEQQFAKIYLSRFPQFFDLKPQAIRVFGYILNQLVPNRDEFVFVLDDCKEYSGYKSESSIRIGFTNFLENDMIARGKTEFLYYINPICIYGNRITFAETYVQKKKIKGQEDPNQLKFDFFETRDKNLDNTEEKKVPYILYIFYIFAKNSGRGKRWQQYHLRIKRNLLILKEIHSIRYQWQLPEKVLI